MSARVVIGEVWQGAREDAHRATAAQKALLGAAAIGLMTEWTATEASLIAVSGAVLEATHSPTLTALATGGTSFIEQAALGLLTVATIRNFPGPFAAVRTNRELRKQRRITNQQEAANSTLDAPAEVMTTLTTDGSVVESPARNRPSLLRRFGDAFGLGTSLNALVKNTSEEYSDAENVKNVLSDASLIGLGVTAIFGVGTEAFSEPVAVDVLSSPWTYATVLGVMVGSRVIENIRRPKETDS